MLAEFVSKNVIKNDNVNFKNSGYPFFFYFVLFCFFLLSIPKCNGLVNLYAIPKDQRSLKCNGLVNLYAIPKDQRSLEAVQKFQKFHSRL